MSISKLYQLVDIPHPVYEKDAAANICYSDIATDANTKTISRLSAIGIITQAINSLVEGDDIKNKGTKDEILSITGIIFYLADLAIATNKISTSANYYSAEFLHKESKDNAA